ncbi:molybdenum cofactor cytidylyltransferase [Sphingomonas guangdongensis]|uniref:Molybdenum cofactor cytidylyltransferase n=1 Tax=Sphingomonas guangdongensis TaxID=1141890 RepID=A0A285QB33_9SPHN|nr:nucleotidyltransferase family protein [Sphingomonas guangdongensis]SOB78649.1 molybdenum cofactor cytidylyltransferase [Sphingomonas guangdongensis]
MIYAEDAVLVLLAAGLSSRFPSGNKLEAEFLGKPVGLHVATALASVPFKERLVVTDGCKLVFDGYDVVHNDVPAEGMGRSVRLGVARAKELGARAVVIALADMPRVTAAHVYRLLDAAVGDDAVVASSDGAQPRPPAVFGAARFDFLLTLEGEAGARDLVRAGKHVVTAPAELIDIDTPEDLDRLMELVRDPARTITRAEARRSD